jgi:hypothetical protein
MTYPEWPFPVDGVSLTKFAGSAGVPQSSFQPDFGPPISRPRATALDETAEFEVMFYAGGYPAFREWWS